MTKLVFTKKDKKAFLNIFGGSITFYQKGGHVLQKEDVWSPYLWMIFDFGDGFLISGKADNIFRGNDNLWGRNPGAQPCFTSMLL